MKQSIYLTFLFLYATLCLGAASAAESTHSEGTLRTLFAEVYDDIVSRGDSIVHDHPVKDCGIIDHLTDFVQGYAQEKYAPVSCEFVVGTEPCVLIVFPEEERLHISAKKGMIYDFAWHDPKKQRNGSL